MTAIKTFWMWLNETGEETPPEVKWIRTAPSKRSSKLPDELPNPDDIQKLIAATNNAREKALISALFDSGCRIGEILTLRMKNIQFDQYGGILLVTEKTGQQRVRIIHSVQRLQTWLDQHASRNNPEAPVFCSISNKSMGAILVAFRTHPCSDSTSSNSFNLWSYLLRRMQLMIRQA